MNIGYVRVSTEAQDPNGQLAALKAVCDEIHTEYASGGRWDRPCLQNVLRHIKAGDVLVVWKLDRLSRSLSDLLQMLKTLVRRAPGRLPKPDRGDRHNHAGGPDACRRTRQLRTIRTLNDS